MSYLRKIFIKGNGRFGIYHKVIKAGVVLRESANSANGFGQAGNILQGERIRKTEVDEEVKLLVHKILYTLVYRPVKPGNIFPGKEIKGEPGQKSLYQVPAFNESKCFHFLMLKLELGYKHRHFIVIGNVIQSIKDPYPLCLRKIDHAVSLGELYTLFIKIVSSYFSPDIFQHKLKFLKIEGLLQNYNKRI